MTEQEKYDDSAKGGYSYEEKLAAVSEGLMAPEEIGLATAEDAQIKLVPESEKKPVFGTVVNFKAGVVPMELRIHWAKQDEKVVGSFDEEAFKKENELVYPIQANLVCGTAQAMFAQTFKDPILGLCQMMRQAADMLESKYVEGNESFAANPELALPDAPTQE